MPLGTHLGGKMGEDGAQDRQLGAKMGPTWSTWNRKCALGQTLFGASWRLFGDLGRENPKSQKSASRLDGEHD